MAQVVIFSDPNKVKACGQWADLLDDAGRLKLAVGKEKKLSFDSSQAGEGKIMSMIEGPSKPIPVAIGSNSLGHGTVVFTPVEEGIHRIHVFWSEHALPNSPYLGFAVATSTDDSNVNVVLANANVIVTGRGLEEAKVGEEAEFIIDGSQAKSGSLEVKLSGFQGQVPTSVFYLGNGRFRCTYTPKLPGNYLLEVLWNGHHLPESPYELRVSGGCFPDKVVVTGSGLKEGTLGKSCDALIDTRKAGPGELIATCSGPTTMAYCEFKDYDDGTFLLTVRPNESGRHVLVIKYGGEHVLGSPFLLRVKSPPDASKVRVYGPGIESGLLRTFDSNFVVETAGAGAGQLTVRIVGPKGGFRVQLSRDNHKDRTIQCNFTPEEIGEYTINVQWSDQHVPGSPFTVLLHDTQDELEKSLHALTLRDRPTK